MLDGVIRRGASELDGPRLADEVVHRDVHGSTHSLAVGVVSPYDVTIPHDIGAIVTEAYAGTLPVDVCFLVANDEVIEALEGMAIAPIMNSRAATVPQ